MIVELWMNTLGHLSFLGAVAKHEIEAHRVPDNVVFIIGDVPWGYSFDEEIAILKKHYPNLTVKFIDARPSNTSSKMMALPSKEQL